jgi:NAD(P)-dependent dehydrogenase (short-subunit alcohol dehydrogenase family)
MPDSSGRLAGKVAIVTGAGSSGPGVGTGKATSILFAREGAKVLLVDRVARQAEETLASVREERGEASVFEADVTRSEECQAMVEAALERYGGVHVLFNNVGILARGTVVDVKEEDWDRVLEVNLKGQFLGCQAAGRRMIEQGTGGRIVNIASTAANNARYEGGAYCAAKAGVVQLTRVLALELGEFGITVNAVGPGFTETPATVETSDEYRSNFLEQVSAGRPGRPSDIANAVLFLASPSAEYVNGQVIYVDGGYSAGKLTVRG